MRTRKKIAAFLAAALVLAMLAGCGRPRYKPKRIREDQIIVYHDLSTVEMYYSHPADAEPASIQAIFLIADGSYIISELRPVQPGETVTELSTFNGEGYSSFIPNVYSGQIVVYNSMGKVIERLDREARLYGSWTDDYDAIREPDPIPPENIELDEVEGYRPPHYVMRLDTDTYECSTALFALRSVNRYLAADIYVTVGGEEYLLGHVDDMFPKSVCMFFFAEKTPVDLMEKGASYPIRVLFYYQDTGELFEEVPGEVQTWDN